MGASSHPHHHYFHPPTSPINFDHHQLHPSSTQHRQQWPALSRPPVSPLVARLLASCPSSVWFVRSLRTSSRTSASSPLPSAPSRSRSSLTSSPSSRTPTSAPSTPSVSPSRARTSSSPAASEASATKPYSLRIWELEQDIARRS